MRIIAFAGPKGSGKDTAAAVLLSRNGLDHKDYFLRTPFAGSLKSICAQMFNITREEEEHPILKETPLTRWPFQAPRKIHQDVANAMRQLYGGGVWAQIWENNNVCPDFGYGAAVVTDHRHPEESVVLDRNGAFRIYIQNDEAEARLATLRDEGDILASDSSESYWAQLKAEAHIVIGNNTTIPDLHDKVIRAVEYRFGNWTTWNCPDSLIHRIRTGGF